MTKSELRLMLRARRRAFVTGLASGADRRELELAMSRQVLARLGSATTLAAYLSNGGEVDPLPALEAAGQQGLLTALPHISDRETPMRFLRWNPGDPFVDGPFGLRQPLDGAPELFPDLILTPLVGFDRGMRRLGQGAAFYDRAFASLPEARRIGLAWSVQEVDRLPADPWDVPLHAVATEKEWIEADI